MVVAEGNAAIDESSICCARRGRPSSLRGWLRVVQGHPPRVWPRIRNPEVSATHDHLRGNVRTGIVFRHVCVALTREVTVTGESRAKFLFSPWWRVAWLIGGIVWAILFNVADISEGAVKEWLGLVSVVPLLALLVDVTVRDRRWRAGRP